MDNTLHSWCLILSWVLQDVQTFLPPQLAFYSPLHCFPIFIQVIQIFPLRRVGDGIEEQGELVEVIKWMKECRRMGIVWKYRRKVRHRREWGRGQERGEGLEKDGWPVNVMFPTVCPIPLYWSFEFSCRYFASTRIYVYEFWSEALRIGGRCW